MTAAHDLARQLVRNRTEADVVSETFAKILDLLHRGAPAPRAPAGSAERCWWCAGSVK